MTPEQWEKIVDLAEAAAALPNHQRPAFLDEACLENDAMRREVESLLAADEHSGGFIEAPVFGIVAELIADDLAGFMVGQVVGAYKIVDLLGVGGMGEVYLAHDNRLGRRAALKFLPGYFISDKSRVRRFEQEARAASALNHPNILTVYDIGEAAGTKFIATEFVEGKTLRQHMESIQMTLGEVLDVAMQAASALAVAHQAGIVHRDIKPENIMLRPDGYIKVLDFGLAKISEQQPGPDSDSLHESDSNTQTGVVLGTPHYMSPEQARGLKVDGRTDIFSLGVVIYEMLTSHKPFDGETTSHVIVAILEEEPFPVSEISPGIPSDLEDVVTRALQKDCKARYQTAEELIQDLRSVRRLLDTPGQSAHHPKARAFPSLQPVEPEPYALDPHLRAPVPVHQARVTSPHKESAGSTRKTRLTIGSLVLLAAMMTILATWAFRSSHSSAVLPTGDPASSAGFSRLVEDLGGGVNIEMIEMPAGSFRMGSPNDEQGRYPDEGPQHEVSVSSFYMGKYEVTQAQWHAVATKLPRVKIDLNPDPSNFKGDSLPVEWVSWEEAIEFCDRLSRATGKTYRLPTEAEWEYACRARTTGPYAAKLDDIAWYSKNSDNKTHPVGTKQPNEFGLYDMHGNVFEWCRDWGSENYDSQSPTTDPGGSSTGSYRVSHGGGWLSAPRHCRSALRVMKPPIYRDYDLGFRLVRT